MKRRWLALGCIAVALGALYLLFGRQLTEILSLENLKASRERLVVFYDASPVQTVMLFYLTYLVMIPLAIPGAPYLSMAGGAIFGLIPGTLIVSFSSTLGNLLAFALARSILREPIRRRLERRPGFAKRIEKGFREEGAFYLFALRLIPVFPNSLNNIGFSVTPIRARTFWWVSQLGTLPATIAYVNAGVQLSRIESAKDIVSPAMILSLAVIGILPLIAKKTISRFRRSSGKIELQH